MTGCVDVPCLSRGCQGGTSSGLALSYGCLYALPNIEQVTRHTKNARIGRRLHKDAKSDVLETRVRCNCVSNLHLNTTRDPFGRGQGQDLQAVLRKEAVNVIGLCPIPMGKPSGDVILEHAVLEEALQPVWVAQMMPFIRHREGSPKVA